MRRSAASLSDRDSRILVDSGGGRLSADMMVVVLVVLAAAGSSIAVRGDDEDNGDGDATDEMGSMIGFERPDELATKFARRKMKNANNGEYARNQYCSHQNITFSGVYS